MCGVGVGHHEGFGVYNGSYTCVGVVKGSVVLCVWKVGGRSW